MAGNTEYIYYSRAARPSHARRNPTVTACFPREPDAPAGPTQPPGGPTHAAATRTDLLLRMHPPRAQAGGRAGRLPAAPAPRLKDKGGAPGGARRRSDGGARARQGKTQQHRSRSPAVSRRPQTSLLNPRNPLNQTCPAGKGAGAWPDPALPMGQGCPHALGRGWDVSFRVPSACSSGKGGSADPCWAARARGLGHSREVPRTGGAEPARSGVLCPARILSPGQVGGFLQTNQSTSPPPPRWVPPQGHAGSHRDARRRPLCWPAPALAAGLRVARSGSGEQPHCAGTPSPNHTKNQLSPSPQIAPGPGGRLRDPTGADVF